MAGLIIKPRARIFHGHDWVYGGEVLKIFGDPQPGDVISLKDGKDRMVGSAIFNPHSQIVARRFSRQRQDLDKDFFRRRISLALEYRQKSLPSTDCCRLVWSESDGLPGLIVDRYHDHLVIQTLTYAMDQRKSIIVEALVELLAPTCIFERNDAPIRKAEGLELKKSILWIADSTQSETAPRTLIYLGDLEFELNLLEGQKTGFYLDQIANYQTVANLAKGKRVLDCFSNQGAFALSCARAGASEVTAIEVSADALAAAKANEKRNAALLGNPIEWIEANVFDCLPAYEKKGAQFDLIILDPPSFTKSKGRLGEALKGYKEIHLRALKLLAPNGLLATFCCSHHVGENAFHEMLVDAMVDAKRNTRLLKRFSQGLDHPIMPTIPETEYLHGYLLEAMPGR